jgi:hypothetical protein
MIGADPQDPATTWRETFHVGGISAHEILASNPLHFSMILTALLLILYKCRELPKEVLLFSAGLAVAFLLFSALIKWQYSGSRYQLPLFVLWAAIIGILIERYFSSRTGVAIAALLLAAAMPFALMNRLRPLAPWSADSILYRPRAALYLPISMST